MESSPRPQYQHFVPRFLLKNFAHPYKPAGGKKKGKRKDDNGLYNGDKVVRSVDLTSDPPVVCERPINRILGQMNMYDDNTKSGKEQRRIEEVLSQFENQAALVFTKITKAYAEHQESEEERKRKGEEPENMGAVCLTRSERDCIRKFLYILKYRGLMDYQRYNHETPGAYVAPDREYLHEYMDEKLYERPLSVWLDNIKQIIDLEMDLEYDWVSELPKRMYPDDSMGLFIHSEMFYMCICTPANPDDEFLMTDNSYNVFEGPNTFIKNKETAQIQQSLFAPFHMFAPVSPKLMIVLRWSMLPNPLEDADDEIRRAQKMDLMAELGTFIEDFSTGLLTDLPVAKPRNNYSKVVNGRLTPIPGYNGKKKKEDRFYFDFFPINHRHVNTINSVFLGNLGPSTSIIFETTATFTRTLEWFLTSPAFYGKIISSMEGDNHKESLRKLEAISRSLGSTKTTNSSTLHIQDESYAAHEAFLKIYKANRWMWKKIILEEDEEIKDFVEQMRKPENEFMRSYVVLGGSQETLRKDIDQTQRMWKLRVRIDSWSRGLDETIRQRNRDLVEEAYMRLPPSRYILYFKLCRCVLIDRDNPRDQPLETMAAMHGPEDTIARVAEIFQAGSLNKFLYNVFSVDIKMRQSLWLDVWQPLTLDAAGLRRLSVMSAMINKLGYIRDCGIQKVEKLAQKAQRIILRDRLHNVRVGGLEPTIFDFLDDGERIELLTRTMVQEEFVEALEARIRDAEILWRLRDIFFQYAYPTPPLGWCW